MNRGFLYGDGFFETMFLIDGESPLMDHHLSRAKWAAEWLEMEWNASWTTDYFASEIKQLNKGHNVARIDFYRNGGGSYVPDSNAMACQISFKDHEVSNSLFPVTSNDFAELSINISKLRPVPVALYNEFRKPITPWSQFKSTSAMFYTKAGLFLKRQPDVEDLILLNESGNICEGLTSNVLIHYRGRWISPAYDQGAVEGVFLTHMQAHMPVERTVVSLDMITGADDILLSNGVRGIRKASLIR
ncbi:MAG: aminotransferase class IV [Bacteroidia bacterium]|nr:aminotransferase class IV [Bacteroidia bacterium]